MNHEYKSITTDEHGWTRIKKSTMATENEFLYKDLTKEILDSAFKVHNALGCGLLEKIYRNALV